MNEALHEVIVSYNEYIKKVPVGCQKIADDLRENQITNGLKRIMDFSEGVAWLTEASELFHKNSLTVYLKTNKIHDFLELINHGLEIQDYVLVADMFEYEIQPFFKDCQVIEVSDLQ
ncbi:hypothetical protein [Psychrobacillus sp. NPDC096389]|uniref:hypothetical protein n=1 Tax=Psychrobacillus sp. NPDC096389 TaxID=3364490 RepID=UPI00382BC487